MKSNFILNLIFLIIGWSTALSILFIAIFMEYKFYHNLKPSELIFYQPEITIQNQTSNYGYIIKNGTNLTDEFTFCTRFSSKAFSRITSFLDNYVISLVYFACISLFLLAEFMDTFVFVKKYCLDSTDTNEYTNPSERDEEF